MTRMDEMNKIFSELDNPLCWEWEQDADGFWHYRFIDVPEIKLYGTIEDNNQIYGTPFYEDEEIHGQIEWDDAAKLVMAKSFIPKEMFGMYASSVVEGAEEKRYRNAMEKRRARGRARGIC